MRNVLLLFMLLTVRIVCGQTGAEMNQQANVSFQKADKELNAVYQKVILKYTNDPAFIASLKAAQRLWIQFRDAELKMKYPHREQGYYGSVYPMCYSAYKEELTRQRIKTLQQWLEGVEEGDVCAGSIKLKR
ncbi:MAG: DUF1311 domain-containing protein [Flavisolibacter sp.]|nr:DUF1311 domain-containing protein [Flavisolibacter sp.]